jgi:triosephosphate isomerase
MSKIIIANWKSNPSGIKEAFSLARKIREGVAKIKNAEVVIAPPFPFLEQVGIAVKNLKLGAQNVFWADGPYTGEVSVNQLKNLGVKYVIVGHSERKIYLGETDDMINKKVRAVLAGGLSAVLCVGERERNGIEIPPAVGEQLKNALLGVKKNFLRNLIVAYEPVWAISTMPGAKPDTPDNAFKAMVYIRKIISGLYGQESADSLRIIYGGSVSAGNIRSFMRDGGMDGALVGGASIRPEEFVSLVRNSI